MKCTTWEIQHDEVILKPQKKATPLHKKRRGSNIIGDVDKALKLLENVDATMKKESEKALKELMGSGESTSEVSDCLGTPAGAPASDSAP